MKNFFFIDCCSWQHTLRSAATCKGGIKFSETLDTGQETQQHKPNALHDPTAKGSMKAGQGTKP